MTKHNIWWTQSFEILPSLQEKLLEVGWESRWVPLIEMQTLKQVETLNLDDIPMILFVSKQAVNSFMECSDLTNWMGKVICSGKQTARYLLTEYGIKADQVHENKTGEQLFREWSSRPLRANRLLVPIGSKSQGKYTAFGHKYLSHNEVIEWIIYENKFDQQARLNAQTILEECQPNDKIVFASPSAWEHFYQYALENGRKDTINILKIYSIGPVTSKSIQEKGFMVIESKEYHLESVGYQMLEASQLDTLSFKRHRRLRQNSTFRKLLAENEVQTSDLIMPLFVSELVDQPVEIPSMPGVMQYPLSHLADKVKALSDLGIGAVILFGIPKVKDECGSGAYDPDGIIQKAIRLIKSLEIEMLVIADTCMCEYTSHGHCGLIHDHDVDNDSSLLLHIQTAVMQAQAGADIIAPSNCMDGMVAGIRHGLDQAGFKHVPIMSYAIKYSSAYYGPFRDAANSAPGFGDRKTYQMPVTNQREAMRELESDIEEGADLIIVKPALAFMDIIYQTRQKTNLPIVAYNVSGEYAMVKAAAQQGWIDEQKIIMESLVGMKRAGADLIISYFAEQVALWLKKDF